MITHDVVIVGGGIVGCSTAFHLTKADPSLKLAVIERDPTYEKASTTLSLANVRTQFSLKENIQISQYAKDLFKRFEEEMAVEGDCPRICHRKEGNLFLFEEKDREAALKDLSQQQRLGCSVEWLLPDEISGRYSLYDPQGLCGGAFGPDDGHLDANAVLIGFRNKARSLGGEFICAEAISVFKEGSRVGGVVLSTGEKMPAKIVVNCAGAWATKLAESANISLPVVPVSRQVFVLDTEVKPEGPLPLTNLPSGLYFRTEIGGMIILGKSMESDPVGFDFSWDSDRFYEILWPELVSIVPAFDKLKLLRGWAGLYAVNTFDGNAILGEWPELPGFFLANGFSGHGFQQGPAVGRYLSELILGKKPSLDLSIFAPERIFAGRPVFEGKLV